MHQFRVRPLVLRTLLVLHAFVPPASAISASGKTHAPIVRLQSDRTHSSEAEAGKPRPLPPHPAPPSVIGPPRGGRAGYAARRPSEWTGRVGSAARLRGCGAERGRARAAAV